MAKATIHERGNGFPDEGAYVPGEGLLWRVVRIEGRICTGNSSKGGSNYVYAEVEEAEWEDCPEEDEFPAEVVTAPKESVGWCPRCDAGTEESMAAIDSHEQLCDDCAGWAGEPEESDQET